MNRHTRARARVCTVIALAVACSALAACGNPTTDVGACRGTPDDVVEAISARLHHDVGRLRNAHQVTNDAGVTFVSAELHDPDPGQAHADRHDKGDLATWAERDGSGRYLSVDEHARNGSSWPRAPFDVRADGAYASRSCTNLSRGKTPAQVECEREQSSPDAVALGPKRDCSDL